MSTTATILKKSDVTSNDNIILTLSVSSTQRIFGKDVPVKKKYCMALPSAIADDIAIDSELPISLDEFTITAKESDGNTCVWLFPKG